MIGQLLTADHAPLIWASLGTEALIVVAVTARAVSVPVVESAGSVRVVGSSAAPPPQPLNVMFNATLVNSKTNALLLAVAPRDFIAAPGGVEWNSAYARSRYRLRTG